MNTEKKARARKPSLTAAYLPELDSPKPHAEFGLAHRATVFSRNGHRCKRRTSLHSQPHSQATITNYTLIRAMFQKASRRSLNRSMCYSRRAHVMSNPHSVVTLDWTEGTQGGRVKKGPQRTGGVVNKKGFRETVGAR